MIGCDGADVMSIVPVVVKSQPCRVVVIYPCVVVMIHVVIEGSPMTSGD